MVAIAVLVGIVAAVPALTGAEARDAQEELIIRQKLETGLMMSEMRMEREEPLSPQKKLAKVDLFLEKAETMLKSATNSKSRLSEKKKALMKAPGVDENEKKTLNQGIQNYDVLIQKIETSKAKALKRKANIEKELSKPSKEGMLASKGNMVVPETTGLQKKGMTGPRKLQAKDIKKMPALNKAMSGKLSKAGATAKKMAKRTTKLEPKKPMTREEKLAKVTEAFKGDKKRLNKMRRRYANLQKERNDMMAAPGIDKIKLEVVNNELKDLAARIKKTKGHMRGLLRKRKTLMRNGLTK